MAEKNTRTALPRISVITPTFNQGAFIEQTIRSVLDQAYPYLEYLVMDGGSTDNTLEILKQYAGRLQWFSEQDHGQSHAINKGIRLATGDVIAYLNSDDVYEPGALLRVGQYCAAHPQARWVTGRCRFINQEGLEIRRPVTLYKYFWLLTRSYRALQTLDYVSQPATFWHRAVIERVGDFDETLYYTMDYDYSLRVGKQFKLHLIPHLLASYRVHTSSKTFTSAAAVRAQFAEDLAVARKHGAPPLLAWLHARHNDFITYVYNRNVAWN